MKKPLVRTMILSFTRTFITGIVCLLLSSKIFAQLPPLQWMNKYGGSAVDIPFTIKATTDAGTIVAGYTDSKDGDVTNQASREYWDLWVVKLDKCGTIQWELALGGSGYESARDIEQLPDGGFIVLGETNSTDGGVVAGHGGTKDIWLLKLDVNGDLQWQRRYGGSGLDIGNHIRLMNDGSFLIAGSTSSNDGDFSGNHGTAGYTDGALLRVSGTGSVVWSKCFGGSQNEELLDTELINGRIYAAGYANSVDGDIPPNQKNYDMWLLAIDQDGNKVFSKIYGGSQNDVAYSMTRGADGSIVMAGYTTSTDGDVSGAQGSQDFWVVNVNLSGTLSWQKVLGGTGADYANSIIADGNGYLVGGISYSSDGDVAAPRGDGDYWLIRLDNMGSEVWQQSVGGSENDHLRTIIHQPLLNEYYLAGDSDSDNGDFPGGHGETDFTIVKYKLPDTLTTDSVVCSVNGFVAAPDTLRDICGYDSVIVTYTPVAIGGPFNGIRNIDTVFAGNSITLPSSGNGNISWDPHPTLSCTDCPNPVATPQTTTVYTANNSVDHCSVDDQFTVVVLTDAIIHVPNAFTPNGDGLNDWFGALGKVPEEYQLQIYNRYGEIVFQSSEVNTRWNGTFKGQIQPNGVFVYYLKYKDRQDKLHQMKGTVVLIR